MNRHPMALRNRRWSAHLAATAVAVALLAGCGNVRIETAAPVEPEPDAIELVRRSAVADALALEAGAEHLAATPPTGASTAAQAEIDRIRALATTHTEALGGEYHSGLPAPEQHADGSQPAAPDESPSTPGELVAALERASLENALAADAAEEPGTARLLAAISAAQRLAAVRLGRFAYVPVTPWRELELADPLRTDLLGTPLPAGLSEAELQTLVLAEDGARYAFEVAAARANEGADREFFRARARNHGWRAEVWARLGGISNTSGDPRRTAYVLPDDFDHVQFELDLEEKLAQAYATLVGSAEPGTRRQLIELLTESALLRDQRGVAPEDFPGLVGFSAH